MRRRAARAAIGVLALAMATAAAFVVSAGAAPRGDAATQARLDAVEARARASVVTVLGLRSHESLRQSANGAARPPRSLASGFIYDTRGHIVTVASAVRDCDDVMVRLDDGREFPAMLVGLDEDSDVALLQVDVRGLPALRRAPAGGSAAGQAVVALGPGVGPQARATRGVVHRRYERPLGSLLMLSNAVYPGFSGGPAVNAHGELLGLIIGHLAEAPADWAEAPLDGGRASFAIAGDDLRTIVSQLEEFGHVRRGFLGVRMVQGEIVDQARPDDPFRIGVRVEGVLPGSPAAQLDLRVGDLIVGWNGETLSSPEDLMRHVEGSPPGTIVPLVWVRDEERHDGRLVVGARPDDDLLATPAGVGAADSARQERAKSELLERVRTLRAHPPGAGVDSSRTRTGG